MTIPFPVTLHIAIDTGDIPAIQFNSISELTEYIRLLDRFNCVWLVTTDGENCQICVTESVQFICDLLNLTSFHKNNSTLFIQEYETYEDAYLTGLDMKEENPKAFNR
jgi:hypothetical protein